MATYVNQCFMGRRGIAGAVANVRVDCIGRQLDEPAWLGFGLSSIEPRAAHH